MIEEKAALVLEDMERNFCRPEISWDGETFVITIITLVELLAALISIYQACKKTPAQAALDMQHPGAYALWRLRQEIHHRLPPVYPASEHLRQSVLHVAGQVTEEEVAAMYEEV